ncbi:MULTISPECIES: LamG-like jellyroll fold domain-containing protein [unclassified Streptomyces]|uniref:LamG-like jellyroll fold domain-containing protein n=1 Tax=unclassified Streptomyces TaxID=2593676 RepID=UPI0015879845|nr:MULTISPECIES: LamG-like jellyroll fold domain-containing protein [unclassified Streptomyces]
MAADERSGPAPRASADADVASLADAQAAAKQTGRPVEVTSMRGESSDVFATPEGNLEAREYLRPIRARVKGAWQPVDTDLVRAADGSVAPKVTTVDLAFSKGGSTPLVRMTKAGRELALAWPGELPAPELDGPVATYRDVLPDVDLRMEAQEDGFTQLLVVRSAEAAANEELSELRLKLAADGMDVKETTEGGLEAVDRGARGAVFEAPKPMMWDSSATGEGPAGPSARAAAGPATTIGTGGEPGPTESGKLAPVGVEIPAGGKELVLTPDADVLRGPDTKYPVFIDPQWYSPDAKAWTMASKYWASSPQWKFNGKPDAGMGYCNWNYCQPHDTKRLMYRISTSKFAGKSILSAEFVVRNTWSASCTAKGVELWRTKDISSSTTWNSQNATGFWIKKLRTASFAHGYDGCSAKDAEFDVKAAVQEAANGKRPTMTFGLRAESESDGLGWKRFSDDAFLRVQYNRPPAQVRMSQLLMEYGGVCKRPANAPRVRTLGTIRINGVTDPDGDNVAVQVQAAWDTGDGKGSVVRWSPSRTSYRESGSGFTITLPTNIPQNKTVHWHVRSHDGAQYSPWSSAGDPTACYFVYDKTVPAAPSIVSGEYPASRPDDPDDPWLDGVGQYGTFTFDTASSDVTRYWYGVNVDPSSARQLATTGGAPKDMKFLPSKPGLNFITAQAFDAAGNGSEIRTYQFRVKAGQPERATWQLDEAAGTAEAAGSTPPRALALNGGASPGAPGTKGTALELNGTDSYASSDLAVVDTTRGFTVSSWVKLSKLPSSAAVVAAQPGNHSPSFELYYSASLDRWVFNQYETDTPDAKIIRAMAAQPGGVSANTWTHLVGSYDGVAKTLRLYINRQLVGETALPNAWNARRGLQIGAGSYSGVAKSFFPGTVDEVQIFDKVITQGEVDKLYENQTVGDPGRPAVAVFPLDEEPGATEIQGRGGVLPAKYNGGVTTGVPGVAGKAAQFNGTTGYAKIGQTSGPHVNTSRSFTISAWAKMNTAKPTSAAVIASQTGSFAPGFELYYSATYDRWAFNQYSADTADAKPVRAMQPDGTKAYAGEWAHLAGVHDTVAKTLTLYVNGEKAQAVALDKAFYADQSMLIGAGASAKTIRSYFPGVIDDVRLFERPVSSEEIQQIFRQRPLVKSRWNFEETTSGTPATTPDSSVENNHLSLYGAAELGMGMVDNNSLQLNGTDTYAATSKMPVDTATSFTMTAWAQAAALPDHDMAVLSAGGAARSALEVRFHPDPADPEGLGRFALVLPDKDSTSAGVKELSSTEFSDVRDWNHIAVVYDGFAKSASLYVNGNLQEIACDDANGDGTADESGCQDLIAWADDVLTFKATGAIQVGRSQGDSQGGYFAGSIDDVWTFQGALSENQIGKLYRAWFDTPTEVPSDT